MANFIVYEQHFTLLEKSMIWSWQRSLNIFLIAMRPWWLWTGALGKSLLVGKLNRLIQSLKEQETTLGWKNPVNCCKTNFTKLFKEPWESMSTALIKTGFRKCGLYPLDRNVIDKNRFAQGQVYSATTPTTLSSTSVSNVISTPDERSAEELGTPANNESSNNISKLNEIESPSTPVNSHVAVGIIPQHTLESFVIPAAKEQTQTLPRVVTKSCWL